LTNWRPACGSPVSNGPSAAATAGLTLIILAAYAPGAANAATSPEKGFRQALELVKGQWQPGDPGRYRRPGL